MQIFQKFNTYLVCHVVLPLNYSNGSLYRHFVTITPTFKTLNDSEGFILETRRAVHVTNTVDHIAAGLVEYLVNEQLRCINYKYIGWKCRNKK
jgi:hypothetical protein